MRMENGDGDEMDSLYSGSMDSEDQADTSKDTSGDEETVDQEDAEENAQSTVVPMSALKGPDGQPVKRGDTIEVKVMDVYGGSDVKICRADAWKGDDQEEEASETPQEEMSEDEELEKLGQQN